MLQSTSSSITCMPAENFIGEVPCTYLDRTHTPSKLGHQFFDDMHDRVFCLGNLDEPNYSVNLYKANIYMYIWYIYINVFPITYPIITVMIDLCCYGTRNVNVRSKCSNKMTLINSSITLQHSHASCFQAHLEYVNLNLTNNRRIDAIKNLNHSKDSIFSIWIRHQNSLKMCGCMLNRIMNWTLHVQADQLVALI